MCDYANSALVIFADSTILDGYDYNNVDEDGNARCDDNKTRF